MGVSVPIASSRASSTTSQRLSEAFARNSGPPKSFWESAPKAFHDFEDIFSKESFDELLEHKPPVKPT
jgi:hypothetical protein